VAIFPPNAGLLRHFPGTRAAVGPRGRDDPIIRIVGTEHSDLATKRTTRGHGLSTRLIHHQRKDEIRRRARGKREEGVLGPLLECSRQLFIRLGTLGVRPNLDALVDLLEELEGDTRDFELSDFVPGDECVKDLLCDVERCEVLNLKRWIREGSGSRGRVEGG
jgi:hypothetical protein